VKTLLLGMGNPILRDDAVGIRLATDIGRRLGPVPDLDVVAECAVGGLELLRIIRGYARLIVFDSIKTRGGIPGAWYRFAASDLQPTMNLTNVHDTNFATALELGRRSGLAVPSPEAIHIFAVEILDNLTFDEQMTPVLEQAYPEYASAIFAEVQAILGLTSSDR
jgi:hydrogenase maturation protease